MDHISFTSLTGASVASTICSRTNAGTNAGAQTSPRPRLRSSSVCPDPDPAGPRDSFGAESSAASCRLLHLLPLPRSRVTCPGPRTPPAVCFPLFLPGSCALPFRLRPRRVLIGSGPSHLLPAAGPGAPTLARLVPAAGGVEDGRLPRGVVDERGWNQKHSVCSGRSFRAQDKGPGAQGTASRPASRAGGPLELPAWPAGRGPHVPAQDLASGALVWPVYLEDRTPDFLCPLRTGSPDSHFPSSLPDKPRADLASQAGAEPPGRFTGSEARVTQGLSGPEERAQACGSQRGVSPQMRWGSRGPLAVILGDRRAAREVSTKGAPRAGLKDAEAVLSFVSRFPGCVRDTGFHPGRGAHFGSRRGGTWVSGAVSHRLRGLPSWGPRRSQGAAPTSRQDPLRPERWLLPCSPLLS